MKHEILKHEFPMDEVGIVRLTGFRQGHQWTEPTRMWPKVQQAAFELRAAGTAHFLLLPELAPL